MTSEPTLCPPYAYTTHKIQHTANNQKSQVSMSPYPTKREIEQLCSHLASENAKPFFDRVSPNVVWDVIGTHPASGHFTSLEDWQKGALGVVNKSLSRPIKLNVVNVIGGGDQEWAAVELTADSTGKNGMDYQQKYAWSMRFDERGIIVQVGLSPPSCWCWVSQN